MQTVYKTTKRNDGISVASEVFYEFCHPIQAEPKACSKDIHIFLEKNEKL